MYCSNLATGLLHELQTFSKTGFHGDQLETWSRIPGYWLEAHTRHQLAVAEGGKTNYQTLDHWIMQLESFHRLSHYGIWAITPCSTNIVSERVIFASFYYILIFLLFVLFCFVLFVFFLGGEGLQAIIPLVVTSLVAFLSAYIQRALVELEI